MSKNLHIRNYDLLNAPDLSRWRFLLEETSLGLACCHLIHLVVDLMSIISGIGETMSCTNDHTFRDDGSTADLCVVPVDAHVPRDQGHVRVFS